MCRTLFQAQIIRALHPVNLYLERQTTQSFSECSVPACFLKIPFCGDVLCLKSFIQAVVGWMSTKASERQGTVLCLYSFSTIYFRHFRSLLLQMPFNPLICRMDNLCRVSFYTSFSLVLILTFQDREPSPVLLSLRTFAARPETTPRHPEWSRAESKDLLRFEIESRTRSFGTRLAARLRMTRPVGPTKTGQG